MLYRYFFGLFSDKIIRYTSIKVNTVGSLNVWILYPSKGKGKKDEQMQVNIKLIWYEDRYYNESVVRRKLY